MQFSLPQCPLPWSILPSVKPFVVMQSHLHVVPHLLHPLHLCCPFFPQVLSDPAKRREYDSIDEFDDSLPTDCAVADFFKVGSRFMGESGSQVGALYCWVAPSGLPSDRHDCTCLCSRCSHADFRVPLRCRPHHIQDCNRCLALHSSAMPAGLSIPRCQTKLPSYLAHPGSLPPALSPSSLN